MCLCESVIFSRHTHHQHCCEFWASFGTRKLTSKFDVLCTISSVTWNYNDIFILFSLINFFMRDLILSHTILIPQFFAENLCDRSSIYSVYLMRRWAWMTLKVVLVEWRILQSNCQLCILFIQLSVINERNKVRKMKTKKRAVSSAQSS